MKITIKDRDIEIKNKIRAFLVFEQLTDKNFEIKTITDILIYFYSLIIANDKDIQLTFKEFMDIVDDNPNLLAEFNQWILGENAMREQLSEVKKKTANQ